MRQQIYQTGLFAFAVVAGCLKACAGPYVPSLEELLPALPPARFAPTSSESISTKIDLSKLRLAWTDQGKSFVELTYSAEMEGAFLKAFPEVMKEPEASVTDAQKRWMLTHFAERTGDKRWLYCVDDGALLSARITGVSYTYDGYDGSVRFISALDKPHDVGDRHLYVSFPCKSRPRVTKREKNEFPRADFEATRNWIKSESDEPGLLMVTPKWFNPDINYRAVTLLDARRVPQTDFNLATVRHELSDLLLFLAPVFDQSGYRKSSEWKCVSVESVADRPGEHCGATGNTTIYALPDFDHDGCRELMVNSSYMTSLYDLSLKDRETPQVLRSQVGLPTFTHRNDE